MEIGVDTDVQKLIVHNNVQVPRQKFQTRILGYCTTYEEVSQKSALILARVVDLGTHRCSAFLRNKSTPSLKHDAERNTFCFAHSTLINLKSIQTKKKIETPLSSLKNTRGNQFLDLAANNGIPHGILGSIGILGKVLEHLINDWILQNGLNSWI